MRKKLFTFISLICLSFAFLLPACGKDKDKKKVQQVEPPKEEITLDKTDITLFIGDEFYIIPSGETNVSIEAKFESSAPNVASVNDDGLLTANNVGEAKITISYGISVASLNVKVETGNYLPSMQFKHLSGNELFVSMVDRANLAAYVNFNGKRFEDCSFTYQVDESYGKVENGFFIPAKTGETTLTVQGAWRGFAGITLQKTLKVKIVNAFEFYVNDGSLSFTTHNKESVGTDYYGKTEIPFKVYCFENNQAVTDITVEITEGTDVIAYDAETETVRVLDEKTGTARIVVTAKDSGGATYTLTLKITVRQSAPAETGYFNPEWLIEKDDFGYFNPDWVTE